RSARRGPRAAPLDPPRGSGEPLVNFLLRSKAGHCEYFASAAAMMLAARGVRARLVTGSYGGEVGAFSNVVVVRGANLHAWVEAELDGSGFQVVEPTPPSGVPPATSRVSWWKRLVTVGREIEFFYDRRIIGFDSGDQVQLADTLRDSVGGASGMMDFLRGRSGGVFPWRAKAVVVLLGLGVIAMIALRGVRLAPSVPAATRAYLALRALLGRRQGAVAPAIAPEEVARLFEKSVPAAGEDVRAVVEAYCEGAFGGRSPAPGAARDLRERLRRIKKVAGGRR
ncbi:MAG: transglutaminase domain-containing protein, partial [Acidobacteriota bacterium]